jgi:hypothetical protein
MTREEAIRKLRLAQDNPDTEEAHQHADYVLCELLLALGYKDVIEEYDAVRKWYA